MVYFTRCFFIRNAPLAQLDRALVSGAKGQRFESSRAHHLSQNIQIEFSDREHGGKKE